MTPTGEREIGAVFGRLPDNPGELACMQRREVETEGCGVTGDRTLDLRHRRPRTNQLHHEGWIVKKKTTDDSHSVTGLSTDIIITYNENINSKL